VTYPNFTMTVDRKKEVDLRGGARRLTHLLPSYPGGFGTSRTRQLPQAYTTSEKPARYLSSDKRSRQIRRLRTDEFVSSEVGQKRLWRPFDRPVGTPSDS
jgi:hypothetical protein